MLATLREVLTVDEIRRLNNMTKIGVDRLIKNLTIEELHVLFMVMNITDKEPTTSGTVCLELTKRCSDKELPIF